MCEHVCASICVWSVPVNVSTCLPVQACIVFKYSRIPPCVSFISVGAYVCSLMYAYVQVHPHVCLSVHVRACECGTRDCRGERTPATGRAACRAEGAWVWDCRCACLDV